ncbi:hypothetical protein B0H19DRAFT_1071595 [Mycena capillaripes]|nr:hypothetical protein B0H19DRAFT_1071595 [Mycena capillaripes]
MSASWLGLGLLLLLKVPALFTSCWWKSNAVLSGTQISLRGTSTDSLQAFVVIDADFDYPQIAATPAWPMAQTDKHGSVTSMTTFTEGDRECLKNFGKARPPSRYIYYG